MRDLTALPKAHLHLHLEGSARPATIAELAEREDAEGKEIVLTDLTAFSTLPEFLECYVLAASTIRQPADLERICYELLVDEAAQGVRWCELMAAPQAYVGRFGSMDDVWAIMRSGFDRAAAEHGIAWGVTVNHLRTAPVELAEMLATWAAENAAGTKGDGIVGFGIAGDEEKVGPEVFTRAF
jgi:adenosine deaminase